MKANAASWQCKPFQTGVPLPYSSFFTAEEFERLQSGLIPQEMEDKWFIYYEAPYLYFHRSWTGTPVYRLTFAVQGGGASVIEAELSEDLARIGEETKLDDARTIDFLINALLLGKTMPFPTPAGMEGPIAAIYQHHISGTAFPCETVAAATAVEDEASAVGHRLLDAPDQGRISDWLRHHVRKRRPGFIARLLGEPTEFNYEVGPPAPCR